MGGLRSNRGEPIGEERGQQTQDRLSERMYAGTPRETNNSQSASITSVALSFRATRMARLSRLNSSMMHNIRERLAVVGADGDEVIGPDMVGSLRPQANARTVVKPQTTAFCRLHKRHNSVTRSLLDFAQLVEVFDGQLVSFVSITQSFNTTTSMCRLALNLLLSFAHFEREVIVERVSGTRSLPPRRRHLGRRTGPHGLPRCTQEKVSIIPEEAKTVRMIFERYLALRSISNLQIELDQKGIRT